MERHEIGVNLSPLKLEEVMKTYFFLTVSILHYAVGWWKQIKSSINVWTNAQDQDRKKPFFTFWSEIFKLTKLKQKMNMPSELT